MNVKPDDTNWFEFIESKIFSKQVRELAGDVLARIQSDLVQNPERGALVTGTHGVRKARIADPASSERVEVIDIFISISSTLAEFTCSTSSAKVNKLTYRRCKNKSSGR